MKNNKYSELKAPKKESMDEEMDMEMMSDLDLEEDDMESGPEMADLASISDDDLLAELESRGLVSEEDMMSEEDDMDLEDEDELLA